MDNAAANRNSFAEDLKHWAAVQPDAPWLVENWQSRTTSITWAEGATQVMRAAAAIQAELGGSAGKRVALLSGNSAHWMLADLATMFSGNVLVPLFTTMNAETIQYIEDLVDIDMLFLGAAENWEEVRACFKPGIPVIRLPGAPELEGAIEWDEFVATQACLRDNRRASLGMCAE